MFPPAAAVVISATAAGALVTVASCTSLDDEHSDEDMEAIEAEAIRQQRILDGLEEEGDGQASAGGHRCELAHMCGC